MYCNDRKQLVFEFYSPTLKFECDNTMPDKRIVAHNQNRQPKYPWQEVGNGYFPTLRKEALYTSDKC